MALLDLQGLELEELNSNGGHSSGHSGHGGGSDASLLLCGGGDSDVSLLIC